MSDPTLEAVQGVRDDVRELRADLTGRLDQMVTRREHESEVRRLDSERAALGDALVRHEESADVRLSSLQAAMVAGDKAVLTAIDAAEERRRGDRRWMAGWIVAAVGAAAAITNVIVR